MEFNKEDIKEWLEDYNVYNYTINSDGTVDLHEDVSIDGNEDLQFSSIPFKLNIVYGDFVIQNMEYLDLVNMPHTVHGCFQVSYCGLETLEGCPKKIHGYLDFTNNQISSLYVGNYDVEIDGYILGTYNDFSVDDILTQFIFGFTQEDVDDDPYGDYQSLDMNEEYVRTIFRYQRHYEIWNRNRSLNDENFRDLMEDIIDGLE